MNGYNGVVAVVNLTKKTVEKVELTENITRKYIGGSGLATYFFIKNSKMDVDPLSPENLLIFMTGPFVGTGVPTSGRHHVVTKSPLTGIFCESDAGGSFGFKLKKAGFDGLMVVGKAKKPVYLSITNDKISFKDAQHLWGLDTYETEKVLKQENLEGSAISCIGQAGEKQVLFAGIFYDGEVSRTTARGGTGAVMGSKNLKAVVVHGTKSIDVYDKETLKVELKEKIQQLKENSIGLNTFGTSGGMENAEKFGDIPIKNWKLGSWTEEVKQVNGQKMKETFVKKNYHCIACPIGCGKIIEFDDVHGRAPEYENMSMLGPACLVRDLEKIAKANDLCNRYGIDTISAGGVIAFVMELFELGIITKEDVGFEVNWGDGDALINLIEDIALNKGFGKVLGQGVKKAAEQIGKGSEKYAIHVKGMELPAHDPRCFKGLAVGYATSNRGACHLSSFTYPWERSASMPELGYETTHDRFIDEGKGELTVKFQNLMGMADSLKICKFALIIGVKVSDMINWLNLITGWDMDFKEFMKTGERIFTLKRMYNTALGISKKDDVLPQRILKEPRGTGGSPDSLPDLEIQLEEYYKFRGWTKNGIPTVEKIKELELEEFNLI